MALITLIGLMVLGGIAIIQLTALCTNATAILEESIRADYDQSIKEQVDNALSMLNGVYAQYENGDCSLDEAKEMGASLLRDLRYGETGYFWADTYDGNCVVLLGNETEGTNRMETKDANGYEMVREIIRVGQEPDGGFVDYMFPKAGETEPSPKRSYSKAFEPFGWVIGTGNYTDYIDTTVALQTKNLSQKVRTTILMVLGIELVILAISLCLSLYIGNSLSKSFNVSLKYIGNMAKGNFSEPLPELLQNRKDDFGVLSEGLENMKHQVSNLIREVKNQGNLLYGIVDRVKDNVSSVSGNVEDVSATTQQLAAGMEETAASSETISNMSHEIEMLLKILPSVLKKVQNKQ